VPDNLIEKLIGDGSRSFRRSEGWPDRLTVFHANPEWFAEVASLPIFRDPEEWLDRAPELRSFVTHDILARSEARRRYQGGESVYILGLDRAVKSLRTLCDGLAEDLAVHPSDVSVQAWAAAGPTSVAMHYDLDFNFNLQIQGRKEWRTTANDLIANPISSYHAAVGTGIVADSGRALPTEMPEDAQISTAEPGDVVWVPQGTWHATKTDEASVAMAFVIQSPTWADHVARVVRDRLHEDSRWRERVVRARDRSRHGALTARAREALAASRDILSDIGPSETLYRSLWGRGPVHVRRRSDVTDWRLDASCVLAWQSGGEHHEVAIPECVRPAVERLMKTDSAWSIAVLHDLVASDDVPFLDVAIARLTDAGFLEAMRKISGGVAYREKQ